MSLKLKIFIASFVLAGMMSTTASAQGGDPFGNLPPPCCTSAPPRPDALVAPSDLGAVRISESLLSSLQLTRYEFIDRLSNTLFPGQWVEIVMARTEEVPSATAFDRAQFYLDNDGLGTGSLVGMRRTSFYQLALSDVTPDELNGQNEWYIKSGSVYVQVSVSSEDLSTLSGASR